MRRSPRSSGSRWRRPRSACTGPASACGTCSSRSGEVLLVRCEDVALILPRAVDVGEPVDEAVQHHVNSCLVCQAELARYHKLLKALRTMRTQLVMPAPGTLAMTLAALQEAQERRAIRSLVSGRRGGPIRALRRGGAGRRAPPPPARPPPPPPPP